MVDANPADTENQIGLAKAHRNIGVELGEIGRRGEALMSYQAERAIFQKLAAANPAVTRYQFELAMSHLSIGGSTLCDRQAGNGAGIVRNGAGDVPEAGSREPYIHGFPERLGSCYGDIAALQSLTGKPKEALDSHKAARAIQQKLVDDNPAITRFQSSLASTHIGMGVLLKKTGKPGEALVSNRAARAIMQKLVDANPSVTSFQGELADNDMLIGTVLSEIGKSEEALASYESAQALQQKLADANPTVTSFQSGLASSLSQTGILLKELGRQEEALMSCKAARAIKQALLDANPTGPREQINLANVDLETGDIFRLIGQSVEARASFERRYRDHREAEQRPTQVCRSFSRVSGVRAEGARGHPANRQSDCRRGGELATCDRDGRAASLALEQASFLPGRLPRPARGRRRCGGIGLVG